MIKKPEMRFNIDALTCLLATNQAPDWEGGLCYKPPLSSGLLALQPVFRERYFKLIGNLLFCLREKVNKYLKPRCDLAPIGAHRVATCV